MHISTVSKNNQPKPENSHKRIIEKRLAGLIGLSKKDTSLGFKIHSPSLLLSQNNDGSENYSFFCANPTNSQIFKDLEEFKKSSFTNVPTNSLTSEKSSHQAYSHTLSNIPFHSGWIGYLAYPKVESDRPSKNPQAEFNYYPWCICLSHIDGTLHLLGKPDQSAIAAFEYLSSLDDDITASQTDFRCTGFKPLWQKTDYQAAFNKVQDYLISGDCYQINLTQAFTSEYQGQVLDTLLPLYKSLNPSFGCYFKGENCELISVSPERFISIDHQGRIEAKPIKGTIKRSESTQEDLSLINDLKQSKKNQAENLMIVDLLRNDLSMSAKAGSVKVDKLFELETHPNVHHLVSTISANLDTHTSVKDAICHAFPGGSITGAPKKRAMEIIEELEAQPRSLYCGSFGYFSDTGNADFNILIRSLEFRDNTITCWGGGGITVESDCDEEYEESLTKIRRIMDTLENI